MHIELIVHNLNIVNTLLCGSLISVELQLLMLGWSKECISHNKTKYDEVKKISYQIRVTQKMKHLKYPQILLDIYQREPCKSRTCILPQKHRYNDYSTSRTKKISHEKENFGHVWINSLMSIYSISSSAYHISTYV